MKPHIVLPFDPVTVRHDTLEIRACAHPQRPCRLHYLFLDPSVPDLLGEWELTRITAGQHVLLAVTAGNMPAGCFALPGIMRYLSACLVDGYVKIDVHEDLVLPPRFRSLVVQPGMYVEIAMRPRHGATPRPRDWSATIHPVMVGAAEDRY